VQLRPSYSSRALAADSPAETVGRHLRWQVLLAFSGILLLASLLGYSSYSVTTVLVPAHGGVFREGVAGNPRFLNPLLCEANTVDRDLCALLYRGLTKIDKQGRVVPDLAQDWTITDGQVYTFRLREDQFWHDGQRVTADDVLFTVGVLQDPTVLGLPDLSLLWGAVQAEKINDFAVRFTLSEPFTPFLDYTAIGLLPRHIYGAVPAAELATSALNANPIGSGPLAVESINAEYIRLKSHPFMAGASPYISALEFHFYPDHPSLFAAFVADEIDGISTVLPADLSIAAQREDLELLSSVQAGYLSIVLNLGNNNTPFFQDKLVRQALYYGLDRDRLVEDTLAGQGIVAHSILLPENWAYNPNVRQYHYNVLEAAKLLDQAGWVDSNGDGWRDKEGRTFEFLLHTSDDPLQMTIVQRIAEDWQKIGVHAVPAPVTFAGLVNDLLVPRKFDAALVNWETPGDPDPYPLWHSTRAEGGGSNYASWRNEKADQLMEKARAITNEEERKQLYWEFQAIFADELPALVLYHPVYTYGVSRRVQNVQIGSLNDPSERFTEFANWYIVTRRVPSNQVPTAVPPTPPGAVAP
jgi:peptide/nickel transport system substrate-binding protein